MTIPDREVRDNTYPDAYISAESHRFSWRAIPRDVLLVVLILLIAGASFGLGMLAGREGKKGGKDDALWIENLISTATSSAQVAGVLQTKAPERQTKGSAVITPVEIVEALPAGGEVVASKTGTKYYLPWCGTVKRIKEENKVWFSSKLEAEKAGYSPAQNCKGL